MGIFGKLFSSEPDIEKLSPDQLNRYSSILSKWLSQHIVIVNPSESVKKEIAEKQARYDRVQEKLRPYFLETKAKIDSFGK